MILLDTNVVSEPMRPKPDRKVLAWLDAQAAESLYLSTVSLAELLLGIESLPPANAAKPSPLPSTSRSSPCSASGSFRSISARQRSTREIVTRARRQGHPIAVADAQIAAIAASRQFTVATRDEEPFQAAGVPVINPWTVSI